ncbi:hypothetical protein VE03_02766 [Pseudogymnoascus sp. 23342-1-I1]|nr:hypothetical protein VE03_02766 [Pseudogymnoascus sp. 23342-1-I1]
MASTLKRLDVNLPNDLSKLAKGSKVCQRLKSRSPNFTYHNLNHGRSGPYRLLETALSNHLPDSVNQTLPQQSRISSCQLPAGYHLVFFPPPTTRLLPDGTDDIHFPGKPWVRRMWAGGSIQFKTDDRRKALTCRYQQDDLMRCREEINDAVLKGSKGNKKIWVDIRRAIGSTRLLNKNPADNAAVLEQAAIVERRDLVFMPAKTLEEAIDDVAKPTRTIKATMKPDFSVSMVPDANLLFRFSALTFNAHRIHLDRDYARTVEGFRNLVVHGPLSILLILKVLSSQMGGSNMVKSITYKNLAPLFADEKMTICVRRSQPQPGAAPTEANDTETTVKAESTPAQAGSTPEEAGSGITKWDVWIENAEGGYAVKGTAETVAAGDATSETDGPLR